MNSTVRLGYDVFVNDPPVLDRGPLPNGEPKSFSPVAATLIYGCRDAILTDPGFTTDHARDLGEWIDATGRNVTDIFITHGHGDHWFAAESLARRFGARVVATEGTIAQMHANIAARPEVWDRVYTNIPPTSVTAETLPDNSLTLEGHDLEIVEVGHSDTDDTSVLNVPDVGLVVAGDVIYNGAHQYLGEGAVVGGFGPWRDAIDKVEALGPQRIVCGHQNQDLDDDAERTIASTRRYLDDADEVLESQSTAVGFFDAMIERHPDYLARSVLWSGASALYGVREHPDGDVARILSAGWL